MRFRKHFLYNYLKSAPVPLARERALECEILADYKFDRPVLDIGCGEGLFASILFDEKIDLGIDPDERELQRAAGIQAYRELICCCGHKITRESKSFNTVFSNSVLEHINDIEPVLSEAHRLLSDDGNFYVTLPTNYFDHYSSVNAVLSFLKLNKQALVFRKMFNKFWKHYHYYDLAGWQNLFQKTGFKVVSSISYGTKSFCLCNDFMVPFTLHSFIIKKLFNRWVVLPGLRSILMKRIMVFFEPGNKNINVKEGGLIFFHLKKNSIQSPL